MGGNHLRLLAARSDVDVAYVCDVDSDRLANALSVTEKASGKAPKGVKDLRQVLDDHGVDAVWIATPDHWHAPAAILALDAGKHVYVEKPCCHNLREGRLMAESVKRSGKILQVGTQSRSTAVVQDAIDRVHGGAIGEVLVAKAWNSQFRGSIGKSKPARPAGSARLRPLARPRADGPLPPEPAPGQSGVGGSDFGCGDIGNDGVHDIDVACWGLGVKAHPARIACLGGKSFFDDDQQFPDTQYVVFEYPDAAGPGRAKQLIFEQRIWSPYVQEGYENGAAFYGTKGMLVIGHSVGWTLYGPKNKKIAERTGPADVAAHHQNFLDCIRDTKVPNADIMVGHRSAALVHLANIGARVGRVLHFDPRAETIVGDPEANVLLSRRYRDGHWAAPKTS